MYRTRAVLHNLKPWFRREITKTLSDLGVYEVRVLPTGWYEAKFNPALLERRIAEGKLVKDPDTYEICVPQESAMKASA